MTVAEPSFEGIWNLRDLGGLPVVGGGCVRHGVLFRSGTQWYATMHDVGLLAAIDVDTAIDLRPAEDESAQDSWTAELFDYRYYHLPVSVPDDPEPLALVHAGGAEHYVKLLEHNAAAYIRALRLMSDGDRHPLLFHCSAGIDRTGVLAALVLSCLDVEQDAVVADYVDSDERILGLLENYRAHPFYGTAAAAAAARRVDADVMRGFLDAMGGTAGLRKWALANGLDEAELAALQAALVER